MIWQKCTFYTVLALWVIAVLFVSPENNGGLRTSSNHDHAATAWSLNWRNVLVTLIFAGIMCLGYSKLRQYLDEVTNALASARISHDPYRVYGFSSSDPEEMTTVNRCFVDCHDRLTTFVSDYSRDLKEFEETIRNNFQLMVEDVFHWNDVIGNTRRKMKTEHESLLSSSGFRENPAKKSHSADRTWPKGIPPPHTHIRNPPAYNAQMPTLFTKEREHVRLAAPERGQLTTGKMKLLQLDRETTEVEERNPTLMGNRRRPTVGPLTGTKDIPSKEARPWYKELPKTNILASDVEQAGRVQEHSNRPTETDHLPVSLDGPLSSFMADVTSYSAPGPSEVSHVSGASQPGTATWLKTEVKKASKEPPGKPMLQVKEEVDKEPEKKVDAGKPGTRTTDKKEVEMLQNIKMEEEPPEHNGKATALLAQELEIGHNVLSAPSESTEVSESPHVRARATDQEVLETSQEKSGVSETAAPEWSGATASDATESTHEQEQA